MFLPKRCYRFYEEGKINSKELINKTKDGAIIVDVRSSQEYKEGHIKGAINIPEYEINRFIQRKLKDKYQLIVLYCECGYRSKKAYMKMKKLGYDNIYYLDEN